MFVGKMIEEKDLSRYSFVFPNRRSSVFFRKYLGELAGRPIKAPVILTVDELFDRLSNLKVLDELSLLFRLWKSYTKVQRLRQRAAGVSEEKLYNEPLDEFFYWGKILLSDFNDIDQYLAEAEQLFTNIRDLEHLSTGFEWMDDRQMEAAKRLSALRADISDKQQIKKRYFDIWDSLLDVYRDFRGALVADGAGYKALQMREVAEGLKGADAGVGLAGAGAAAVGAGEGVAGADGEVGAAGAGLAERLEKLGIVVFVGFSAPTECEKELMKYLKKEGKALFYWDYYSKMIKEPENKSSMLISKCVADFPGEELPDKERFEKMEAAGNEGAGAADGEGSGDAVGAADCVEVEGVSGAAGGCSYQVIPAAGEVEQTMIAAKLLKEIKMREMEKGWVPMETAIVVSDETLLLPLLSVIDETDINITMGYPVRATAVASLFNSLAALHLRARKTKDGLLLSGSVLREILSHPYVLSVDEADAKRASDKILKSNMIFVGAGQLLGEHPLETKGERMRELLQLLVPPMETELASAQGSNLTFEIVGYLRRILEYVSKFLTSRERCFVNGLHEVLDAIASSAIGSVGAEAADGSVAGEGRAGVADGGAGATAASAGGGAGATAASAAGDAVAGDGGAVEEGSSGMAGVAAAGASGDGGAVVEGSSGMAGAAAAGASGEAGAAAAEAFGKARTVYSIIRSGLNGRNVAFRGEPLSGVQIMGPLETRCLDFKNIIFLSFNDGVFPASGERTSAIPYFLRKAFKLPTYEDKDSISSYNFYRLIQRAENVYMIYDTNTANIKTKEESRFIKQLVYDFGIKPVKRTFSTPVPTPKVSYTDDIILTEEEKERLRKYFVTEDSEENKERISKKFVDDGSEEAKEGLSKYTIAEEIEDNKERLSKYTITEGEVKKSEKKCLSPSSLNNYLDCNRRFFFEKILKLGKDEDLTDSVEASTYGSIYHCCMEQIYGQFLGKKGERKGKRVKVTKEFAEKLIAEYKDEEKMRELIDGAFKDTMQVDLIEGENLVIRESVKKYIWITLEKDLEKAKKGEYWFEGAEYEINEPLFSSRGFIKIDRLENEKGIYRVCDYKSGRFLSKAPKNSYSELEDGDFPKILNEMFKEGVKRDKEYTILLQLFFYALMLSNEKSYSGDMELCVYQLQLLNKCGPIVIKVKRSHIEAFAERLKGLIDEIEAKCAPDCVARMPICTDINVCKYCDFKTICNREVKDE